MNIFATSLDPVECAQVLDDKRVVKMIVETAQMLSTAVRLCSIADGREIPDDSLLYKVAMPNHPCSIWARECQANFVWLLQHGSALIDEYKYRYNNRIHLTAAVFCELSICTNLLPATGEITEFADCSQTNRIDLPVIDRYKLCMQRKWRRDKRSPVWTKRDAPDWFN